MTHVPRASPADSSRTASSPTNHHPALPLAIPPGIWKTPFMPSRLRFSAACATAILMAACGARDRAEKKEPVPPPGAGPKMRTASSDGGRPVSPGGNQDSPFIEMSSPDELVFTDPDNPDAGIPQIESLMAAPKRGPWEDSETIARQTAAREGKPILVWFTDSARSPMCKALAAELFSTKDFGTWAEENVVRLRVDANISASKKPEMSMGDWDNVKYDISAYVKRMRKRYRVLGNPTILLLNPGGEVLLRDTGYKRGEADYLWGILRQGKVASDIAYISWRGSLEAKGYREWQGKQGRKVFAKLGKYHAGQLILIEPGGERYRTTEANLSKTDMKWIENQKATRGIE